MTTPPRFTFLAVVTCPLLLGCGGPETSQANNAQANVSNTARPSASAAASAVTAVAMSPASGDPARAIMHERHEGMESIGKANKTIRDQLQEDSPDLAVVRSNAARIADLSQRASGWFHSGTGPELGKTGAKPEIWQNPQDFLAKLGAFQKAARDFESAADGTDLNAINRRLHDLGRTCNTCHQKYRRDMHHEGMLPT